MILPSITRDRTHAYRSSFSLFFLSFWGLRLSMFMAGHFIVVVDGCVYLECCRVEWSFLVPVMSHMILGTITLILNIIGYCISIKSGYMKDPGKFFVFLNSDFESHDDSLYIHISSWVCI